MSIICNKYGYMGLVVAIACVSDSSAQGLDKLFGRMESLLSEEIRTDHAPGVADVRQKGSHDHAPGMAAQTANREDVSLAQETIKETDKRASPPGKTSVLDDLMGSDPGAQRPEPPPEMTKAALLADFERDYLEKSNDAGRLLGMQQSHLKVAHNIAITLPAEFGVSEACVQQRSRDGRISGTAQAMTIAAAMYDVLDQLVPARNKSVMLRDRVNWLSMPGTGCPADFSGIKRFLTEYSEFAKGMVERKQKLVAEKRARDREQAQQVKLATDRQRDEVALQERTAQVHEADVRRQKMEADARRKAILRSGAEKPVTFKDHLLMHDYMGGDSFYGSPLLKPDNKVYLFGIGGLDREEDGWLIVKSPGGGYIHVKTSRSTPMYGDLRMNMPIVLIGRYVGNTQYTTIIGSVKTAPVIDAIAISKAPVYW